MLTDNFGYGAVTAKARAMYGKRFKRDDYQRIINMTSVAQIASYLKAHPGWKAVLSSINEANISRSYLESLIRTAFFRDYKKLLTFISKEDKTFYKYLISSLETDYCLAFIKYLNAGNIQDYRQHFTQEIDEHLPLDIAALTNASTYEQMLDAAKETDFYHILKAFTPQAGSPIDYTALECAIDAWRFNKMLENAEKQFHGSILRQLKKSLGTQIDIINISRVMRLRNFFLSRPEEIFKFLIPVYGKLDQSFFRSLFLCADPGEANEMIKHTHCGSYFDGSGLYVEYYYEHYLYVHYRKLIYSEPSILVPVSYLFLKQNEISNLTNVIESVRYGVPPAKMYEYLAGVFDPLANS